MDFSIHLSDIKPYGFLLYGQTREITAYFKISIWIIENTYINEFHLK